jgi:hypothetical protein
VPEAANIYELSGEDFAVLAEAILWIPTNYGRPREAAEKIMAAAKRSPRLAQREVARQLLAYPKVQKMNEAIQTLLAEGRRTLAQRESAEQQRDDHERRRKNRIFQAALAKAIELLEPVLPVEPSFPDDNWDPDEEIGNNLTFSVRPFGAARIEVRLGGVDSAQGPSADPSGWTWLPHPKQIYHVEARFAPYKDGVLAERYETTNSLAEALAICERSTDAYRQAEAKAKEHKPSPAETTKSSDPGEQLLDSLDVWIHWLHPGLDDLEAKAAGKA